MCILPNFAAKDLARIKRDRKKKLKEAIAETVEIITSEQLLENSV
jgi:hypothetical protein